MPTDKDAAEDRHRVRSGTWNFRQATGRWRLFGEAEARSALALSKTLVSVDTTRVEATLSITFDGDVPGLTAAGLSLVAFGDTLEYLPTAIRHLAADVWRETTGAGAPRRGNLPRISKMLDVQLTGLTFNTPATLSARVAVAAEVPPEVALFAGEVPELVCQRLVQDVAREASGRPGHWAVRKLLGTLPHGLRSQTYVARAKDGRELARTEVTDAQTSEGVLAAPLIDDIRGHVVGVIDEATRHRIEIRTGSRLWRLEASSAQCRTAVEFFRTDAPVEARIIDSGGQARLLILRSATHDAHVPWGIASDAERSKHIQERWRGVLSRLAQ